MEGHAAPPAEGGPPEPQGTRPPAPQHPTALPVHGCSPPHGAAVAGPPHPHPKTTPTSRRRTCPASSDASSAPSTTFSKGTHASWSRYGHPPGNPLARTAETTPPHQHQHAQVTRESARTRPVPKPAPLFSLLPGPSILRPPPKPRALRRPPQPSPPPPTPQPPPPQPTHPPSPPRPHPALHPPSRGGNLPKRAPKPVPTASNPAAAKADALTRPAPATRPKPNTAAKQPPEPVGAPRPQPAAKPEPKRKPGATTAARARPPEDVLYDVRPQPSQARRKHRPARRPPTVADASATTFMAERAAAEARRTSTRHLSKPAPQADSPPPTGPDRCQGPPAASPPP